ncbi:Mycobacterium numidiamassiliense ORFan [Mycobacterium numidiamassiliense]|uniref:Mycobacterium numidiamassiliense ORFan n=1 Tax=Mycobacterium numidiamassiliense TaxID=1841861 RepID=A0A2U3PIQ3_9MYCO|nr:hypothetical protein [Mycobacterium numidiamassiliense]SPM43631.1 Mycobacterium numidiamassiliense ORFan [Mycobacterium numidiamassiliense]
MHTLTCVGEVILDSVMGDIVLAADSQSEPVTVEKVAERLTEDDMTAEVIRELATAAVARLLLG